MKISNYNYIDIIECNNDTVIYEDQKRFTTEEKNSLAWFAYEEIVRRITQDYFKL